MNDMTKLLLGISLLIITGLLAISIVQNHTIIGQRKLLRVMETNPACMVDPVKARQDFVTMQERMKAARRLHITEN